jgi:hypothetical protein
LSPSSGTKNNETVKMKAAPSVTSVDIYPTTRRHIVVDSTLHSFENLKSNIVSGSSGYSPMVSFCEHGNEISPFISGE